jgi:hypothetical protein
MTAKSGARRPGGGRESRLRISKMPIVAESMRKNCSGPVEESSRAMTPKSCVSALAFASR